MSQVALVQECTTNMRQNGSENHYFDETTKIWYTADGRVITTLRLTLDQGLMLKHNTIFDHFSGYGEVKNVRIHDKPKDFFSLVTFTQAESLEKAFASQCHTIAGYKTKVAIADSEHQTLHWPIYLTNSTSTHLLDLNDDCLLEIMSEKSLPVIDLCSIARTSVRLWDIANQIFWKKYKICNLRSVESTISQNKRTLVTFGSLISELSLDGKFCDMISTSLLDLVSRCCNNSLSTLNLWNFKISDKVAVKLFPIFQNLQKIDIAKCTIEDEDAHLFANCGSLLKFDFISSSPQILQNTFPKLQRFVYYDCNKNSNNLNTFLTRHKNLEVFETYNYYYSMLTTLSVIADNCHQLEELKFRMHNRTDEVFTSLLRLEHLRKLQIDCNNQNVTKLTEDLKSCKSLQYLEFRYPTADMNLTSALSQLKGLHVLKLINSVELKNLQLLGRLAQLRTLSIIEDEVEFDLVDIIEGLINLQTLELKGGNLKLDQIFYSRIVDVVRWRSQGNLKIVCYETNRPRGTDLQIEEDNRQIVEIMFDDRTYAACHPFYR